MSRRGCAAGASWKLRSLKTLTPRDFGKWARVSKETLMRASYQKTAGDSTIPCECCNKPCEPEFVLESGAICSGCFCAIGALHANAPEHLSDIPAWPMHVAKVMADPNCGFECGFCGEWRPWAEHGFNDHGVRHCTQCVDALDALRDGVDDALAIFRRGGSA